MVFRWNPILTSNEKPLFLTKTNREKRFQRKTITRNKIPTKTQMGCKFSKNCDSKFRYGQNPSVWETLVACGGGDGWRVTWCPFGEFSIKVDCIIGLVIPESRHKGGCDLLSDQCVVVDSAEENVRLQLLLTISSGSKSIFRISLE